MKIPGLAIVVFLTTFVSCTKPNETPGKVTTDMSIIAANTPLSISKGQDIIAAVRCQGPNLCYSFSHFSITEASPRQFEIRAKALYPDPRLGSVACAEALYTIDTTVAIQAASKGQYLLRFYNATQLFKTDTVEVN